MPSTVTLDAKDMTMLVLLFALYGILAVPAGLALRWWYSNSVLRAMRRRAREAGAPPASEAERRPPPPGPLPPPPEPRIEVLDADERVGVGAAAASLFRQARRARWSLALVYALAGGAYTFAALLVYLLALPRGPEVEHEQFMRLCVALSLLWPMAPVVAAVGASRAAGQLLTPALYLLLVFMLLTVFLPVSALPGDPAVELNDPQFRSATLVLTPLGLQPRALIGVSLFFVFLFVWPLIMFAPTVMFLALHYLRAVGIVAGLGMALLLVGAAAAILLLKAGLGGFAFAGLWLLVFAAAAGAAWLLVRLMARRYVGKKMSDQAVVIDSYWLAVSVSLALWTAAAHGLGYGALFLLPFAAYKLALWAGLRLRRAGAAPSPDIRLLLLRVFSNRRTRGLLEEMGRFWRYVGSVQLIAGADLATANLEIHEFLDFVSRRLGDRFIKDRAHLEGELEALDLRPDPDGRYRVNEFFCYEDTWRETLVALVGRCDAVLMDLRGFTCENEGCVYELRQLLNIVPADRLVLTADRRTDFHFLYATLGEAWRQMDAGSPNRAAPAPPLRVLYAPDQSSRAVRRLLSMLFEAAQAGRRTDPARLETV